MLAYMRLSVFFLADVYGYSSSIAGDHAWNVAVQGIGPSKSAEKATPQIVTKVLRRNGGSFSVREKARTQQMSSLELSGSFKSGSSVLSSLSTSRSSPARCLQKSDYVYATFAVFMLICWSVSLSRSRKEEGRVFIVMYESLTVYVNQIWFLRSMILDLSFERPYDPLIPGLRHYPATIRVWQIFWLLFLWLWTGYVFFGRHGSIRFTYDALAGKSNEPPKRRSGDNEFGRVSNAFGVILAMAALRLSDCFFVEPFDLPIFIAYVALIRFEIDKSFPLSFAVRLPFAFMYFWSGVNKMNPGFMSRGLAFLIEDFVPLDRVFPQKYVSMCAFIIALGEASGGLALILPYDRIRREAGFAMVAMHAGIVLIFARKGIAHIVWGINFTCIVVLYCVAVRPNLLEVASETKQMRTEDGMSLFQSGVITTGEDTFDLRDSEDVVLTPTYPERFFVRPYVLFVIITCGILPAGYAFFIPPLWIEALSFNMYSFNDETYHFTANQSQVVPAIAKSDLTMFVDQYGEFDQQRFFDGRVWGVFTDDVEGLCMPKTLRGSFSVAEWLANSLNTKVQIRIFHKLPLGLSSRNVQRTVTDYECSKDACVRSGVVPFQYR